MKYFKARLLYTVAILTGLALSGPVLAASPNIDTPAPIIHLADNLDEKDNLGWCIDTVGRGFSDRLHAHSCKPANRPHGDVQFRYDTQTRQIMSAEFANKCAELLAPATVGGKLGLLDCSTNSALQKFDYDVSNKTIRIAGSQNICLAVAPTSRKAGPFMSRDLVLEQCDSTATKFKQWVIKSGN